VALEKHFPHIVFKGTFSEFARDVWEGKYGRLKSDDFLPELYALAESGSELFPSDPQSRARVIALVAATGYCNLSINAAWAIQDKFESDADDRESDEEANTDAWGYYFDAGQWEGLLTGLLSSSVDAVSQFAHRGAKARSESSKRMKNEAIRLYREKQWRSPRVAAQNICEDVRQFGIREGLINLTPTNVFRTVYEWLLDYSKESK